MTPLTRTQGILLGLIFVVLVATKPLYAAPQSCWSTYASSLNSGWTTYDMCVKETNDDSWYMRLAVRQYCRVEWISNAFQSEGEYVSCMSGFQSIWDR